MVPYQQLIKSKYFSLFLYHTDLTDIIFTYIGYYMVSQVVLATFKVGESGFGVFPPWQIQQCQFGLNTILL